METKTIIYEIQRLPFSKQIYIAERIIKSIRHRENNSQMKIAAENLYKEYLNDNELTIFTDLDFERFYKTTI